MSGLGVDVLTSAAAVLALREAWQELFDASPDAMPYLSPAWALTWWRHFGGRTGAGPLAGVSRPHVLAVRDGRRLVGLAPWLETRIGIGPVSVRTLVGMGQETADYGGVLLGDDPARVAPVLIEALDRELNARHTVYDCTRLAPEDPWTAALASAYPNGRSAVREMEVEPYPYLDLAAMEDAPRTVARLLKRNDVGRRWRRLDEASGASFTYHRPGCAVEDLGTFLRLHDLRWATKDHPPVGIFATASGRAFLAEASEALDAAGMLRISLVYAGDQAIGGRFGIEHRGVYQGLQSGWDPAFAPFGPGHLVVGKILEHAAAAGLRGVDFMRGGGDHKSTWADGERSVPYLAVGPNGRSAPLHDAALRASLSLRIRRRGAPTIGGPS